MTDEIQVKLMRRAGRGGVWEAYWIDPITRKQRTTTTGTSKRNEAERFAARKEMELNSQPTTQSGNWTFEYASERYLREHLASRAEGTQKSWCGTRNWIRKKINPKFLNVFTADLISKFTGDLRDTGMEEATIKKHLAHLKAFLGWCNGLGGLRLMPRITLPKRTGKMRGRAITLEEFERYKQTIVTGTCSTMIARGPRKGQRVMVFNKDGTPKKICPDHLQPELLRTVDGLWLSGLRLDEALDLSWDTGEIRVLISGDHPPRLRIEGNADKSTEVRILPLAPEFGEFLLKTPPAERRGRVFRPVIPGQVGHMRLDTMSKYLERIGHKAGILEYEKPPKRGSKVPRRKWASAHSFRRAFGTRWSKILTNPLDLMILMRHKDIETTKQFYLDTNANSVEEAISKRLPNKVPNIDQFSGFPEDAETKKT